MIKARFISYFSLAVVALLSIIATSSLLNWSRYGANQPVEISMAPEQELIGEIYVGGAVVAPGFYPLKSGDGIEDLIKAAGGTLDGADNLKLSVNPVEEEAFQKVNLNNAEAWLLQALPGIGETRAEAIMEFRRRNGKFQSISDLLKVEGIGTSTYERVKEFVTVAD